MRSKARYALIAAAIGTGVLLALVLVTVMTGSWIAAAAAALLGLILVVAGALLGLRVIDRSARTADRTSTRLRHIERRLDDDAALVSLREEITALHGEIDELRNEVATLRPVLRISYESAMQLGRDPAAILSPQQAQTLFDHYVAQEKLLELAPLIRRYDLLDGLKLATLRVLYRFYRDTGYWDICLRILERIVEKSGRDNDRRALAKIQQEVALYSTPISIDPGLPSGDAHDPTGPILHIVGKVLPRTQSGYTLRTQYTAKAQSRRGLPVAVVGQCGISDQTTGKATRYSHDGIDYHLLSGPSRTGALLEEWMRANIERLAELVRELRPSILHAHSDFYNALIAHAVGTRYGIPVVYETRGFWEETWLTRTIAAQGWREDAETLLTAYGRPDAYELRKGAEASARLLPQHNFTLARVMKEHILESADGVIPEAEVTVVPNAVEPSAFPVQERDAALAARWGVPQGAVTVGYISSMVSYEGIDTLIDAFHLAQDRVTTPLHLLLVGDGKHLPELKRKVEDAGIGNVVFTGAVPHEEVLSYYGLIDIFVVPRQKSSVADLVTPLKPFEALATGRAVILSDVGALREIARDSGAVETFRAGDAEDLCRTIIDLVAHSEKRQDLGDRAANWVREHRTWDANVLEYYRAYRRLGYRGAADPSLDVESKEPATPLVDAEERRERPAKATSTAIARRTSRFLDLGRGRRAAGPAGEGVTGSTREKEDGVFRVVVVAMKPQIAGRIRRNIQTLLDMGAEVIVVNSTPRDDFFQGLSHPRLSADFIDVKSLAVRYQARMTRKKNERQAAWDRQKLDRAQKVLRPAAETPEWMTGSIPGSELVRRAWISAEGRDLRNRARIAWDTMDRKVTRASRDARTRRDLTIRDQLKQIHLVNRFAEFWRLAPDRIALHEPDLVVSSDLPGLVGASIAAERLGVPHLHDCHELYLESTTLRPYERRLLAPVEKHYMRKADSVVVVNQSIRDEYLERYGVRGRVVRNCAPAVPEEVREHPVDLHELAGIPADAKIVLYQGGLMAGRGLDVCVRAVQHLPEDVHLVFIGKGRQQDDLKSLAEELGVGDRVHWLSAVEPGDLPRYTAGADLGVIPYQPVSMNNRLALPNKVFEYTGAGIPLVASDLPEIRRIIDSTGCGATYNPFDPEDLAAAVGSVLCEELYSDCRQSAARFGRENTWEQEREVLVTELRRLSAGWMRTSGAEGDIAQQNTRVDRPHLRERDGGRHTGLRIAMVVHNSVRHDARVLKSAASLKARGHDVRIFGLTPEETEDFVLPNGVLVHLQHWDKTEVRRRMTELGLPAGKENAIRTSFRLQGETIFGAVRALFHPDAIHIHDHLALTAAAQYKEAFGVPIVWDAHEIYEDLASLEEVRAAINSQIIRENVPYIDGFITLNQSIANFYRGKYPGLPEAVLLPNAVDRVARTSYDGRLHEKAGLHPDQKILLFQGGYSPHRGIPALLEASRFLDEDWSLVFMGWGKLSEDIRAYADDTSDRPAGRARVAMVPGAAHDELLHWTAGAALGSIPYENTGLNHLYCSPNKLWEYPAAGVPILATDMPEMKKKIEQYDIGLTVDRRLDPAEIAAAVNALSESDLSRMRINCGDYSAAENWQEYEPRLTGLHVRLGQESGILAATWRDRARMMVAYFRGNC